MFLLLNLINAFYLKEKITGKYVKIETRKLAILVVDRKSATDFVKYPTGLNSTEFGLKSKHENIYFDVIDVTGGGMGGKEGSFEGEPFQILHTLDDKTVQLKKGSLGILYDTSTEFLKLAPFDEKTHHGFIIVKQISDAKYIKAMKEKVKEIDESNKLRSSGIITQNSGNPYDNNLLK